MKTSRSFINYISVAMLLLWGGILLHFYISGRLVSGMYLAQKGLFIPMVLVAGIGLVVLGIFNLLTLGNKDADCCGHDHGHDHDHDDEHDHHHHENAHGECCGHNHVHEHAPDHVHSESCGHDHGHDHVHSESCGHDHSHEHHDHDHAHAHDHGDEPHVHGLLEESGLFGRIMVILILCVPVTYAALTSPDHYSANAVINKGVYSNDYSDSSRAGQGAFKKEAAATAVAKAAPQPLPSAVQAPASPQSLPPAATTTAVASTPPPPADMADPQGNAAATQGAQSKSYGKFTLADLKAQVPQDPKTGEFLLEVPEIYYTAGDKEVQSVLAGQPVQTTAQVIPEKLNNADGKRVRIFRLLIQCCAADARPYSIPVQFDGDVPKFKDMTWVKVTGTMAYKQEGGQTVPVLIAKSMTESVEPDGGKAIY